MHTIKPLDTNVLAKYCHDCKLVVTCEEGFVSGGLGAAVAETLGTEWQENTTDAPTWSD